MPDHPVLTVMLVTTECPLGFRPVVLVDQEVFPQPWDRGEAQSGAAGRDRGDEMRSEPRGTGREKGFGLPPQPHVSNQSLSPCLQCHLTLSPSWGSFAMEPNIGTGSGDSDVGLFGSHYSAPKSSLRC